MSAPQRIVVKLGTQVVVDQSNGTIALPRVCAVVDDIAELRRQGNEVILVSSGAVGLGRQALKLSGTLQLHEKQACAAVGQARLMDLYSKLFDVYSLTVAQILVTAHDFTDRTRYLNLRNTFERLLEFGAIPVVNENDVVSIAGIVDRDQRKSFDDNDKLSALVSGKLEADTLIILTNVDGVFTSNPDQVDRSSKEPPPELIREIRSVSELGAVDSRGQSSLGRGGMTSKLEAAKAASLCGVKTIISSGFASTPVRRALDGQAGTSVHAHGILRGRKRWIGTSSGYSGIVTVDDGAKQRLLEQRCSLLPVGVLRVGGNFEAGDVVSVEDSQGREFGRGLAGQSSATLRKIVGSNSSTARAFLSAEEKEETIHRDNLVLFEEAPLDS
jgi:glutamate 5-kinase